MLVCVCVCVCVRGSMHICLFYTCSLCAREEEAARREICCVCSSHEIMLFTQPSMSIVQGSKHQHKCILFCIIVYLCEECVCVIVWGYPYVCVCVFGYHCGCLCVYNCVCVCIIVCVCVNFIVFVCVCLFACMCLSTCACMCVYVLIYHSPGVMTKPRVG